MKRVAIARVAQLIGRINPFKAVPTIAKMVLNTQKLSNPSTTHLYCIHVFIVKQSNSKAVKLM
jgi:hypothetical protein